MDLLYLPSTTSERLAFNQSSALLNMEEYGMEVDMDVDFGPINTGHNAQQVLKSAIFISCSIFDKFNRHLTSLSSRFQHTLEMGLTMTQQ